MLTVRSLRRNVGEAEARSAFEGRWAGPRRWVGGGSLRAVAMAYVPFRLYEVEIVNAGRSRRAFFALEAVTGSLDLYGFARPPAGGELEEIETRNRLEPGLGDGQALEALKGKLRRVLFQTGFFRIHDLHFRAEAAAPDLYVPYWIGLYSSGAAVRLRVLDAVRRRFEGAKARALFEGWLSAPASPSSIRADAPGSW